MSTLRNRLAALVDNPRVKASGRDLDFIKSMAAYYERTGRLTSGRKAWLDKLEAKYAADAPDHSDQSIASRISAVRNKVADGSWDANFLDSIAEQNRSRGQLSPRQVQILEKIEDNNSDDVIARRASWAESYTPEMAERMRVAAAYYLANPPYYRELANKVWMVRFLLVSVLADITCPTFSHYPSPAVASLASLMTFLMAARCFELSFDHTYAFHEGSLSLSSNSMRAAAF